ncbi:SDR family oxidoreductase [Streptomyces sp. BE20]|uniref:SDR family NAD(P)-dependent oxidoreductase n=1 Tax=Streptomyces sp. BE20 TaxID=3002525 RepID=UPI002E78F1C9|nr:SDR family oxidoreductase [Streptomyces sp. BE20]MEE1823505.1 SDR family oxidoreductase [Streptomyces sp. BE20]
MNGTTRTREAVRQDPRVVVVTGAGTGIGQETAWAFAAQGPEVRVVAVGRRAEPLAETASRAPGRIVPLAVDITAPDGPEAIVRETLERFGRLDVLVNNAGIAPPGPLGDYPAEGVGALLATNLTAPVLLGQAALAALTESRGVIVNVSTAVGQRGWPTNSVYAAGKAAIDTITRSWAVELAPRGIRVVAVAPGAIETPIAGALRIARERLAVLERRIAAQHEARDRLVAAIAAAEAETLAQGASPGQGVASVAADEAAAPA